MKRFIKRTAAVLLALTFIPASLPIRSAAAVYYPREATYYLSPAKKQQDVSFNVSLGGETLNKSAVKVSDKSIASLQTLEVTDDFHQFSQGAGESNPQHNLSATIYIRPKKAGTTKISYTVGRKTYQTKVKILKYENPLKSLKISGIDRDLASDMDKKITSSVKLKKKAANAMLSFALKKGWRCTSFSFTNEKTHQTYSANYIQAAKQTYYVGNLKKGQKYTLQMTFKTEEMCSMDDSQGNIPGITVTYKIR